MTILSITAICELLESKGNLALDTEPVSLVQHALQTAFLAERAGAERNLICACLLHDLGHLLDERAQSSRLSELEDEHPRRAVDALSALFGAAVIEPIRLHVEAKRYLCYARPGYAHGWPPDAMRLLDLQGGMFCAEQARAFMREPYAVDAVNLRLWDDRAKTAGLPTPSLAHYAALLRMCVLRNATPAGAPMTE